MKSIAHFTIPGNSPRKSNSREIVTLNGRPASIKSAKARDYVDAVHFYVPEEARLSHDGPILVIVTMFYASRRSDLSTELVQDALQIEYAKDKKGKRIIFHGQPLVTFEGVYKDDRQIFAILSRKQIDPDNPRAEITVYALDSEEPWAHLDHDAWARTLAGALETARQASPLPAAIAFEELLY